MTMSLSGSPTARIDVNGAPAIASAIVLGTVGVLSFIIQPGIVQGFVATLGMTEVQAVDIAGLEMLGVAAATIVVAIAGARVDWRLIVAIGLALAMLGDIGSSATLHSSGFAAARVVAGLGEGAIISISFTFVGTTIKAERNIALYLVLLLTYGAFGLWYLPAFLDLWGFLVLFWCFAAISAAAAVTIFFVPRRFTAEEMANPEARQLSTPLLGVALAGVLAYNVAQGIAWAILFLVGVAAGHGEQRVADALFLSQILAVAGALASVALASRIERNRTIAFGIIAGAASIALLIGKPSYGLFVGAVCGFNFLWNFVLPFILGRVCDFDEKGRMMAPAVAMQMIGLGGGPLIAAQLIGGGHYAPAEIICVALFFASYALLVVPIRHHRQRSALRPDRHEFNSGLMEGIE